jgi:hypothetical protein
MKTISALFSLALLAGCAPQLEGDYVNDAGAQAFTLAHGKYYGSSASEARAPRRSVPIPYPYKVDGKLLIVEKGDQQAALEILPNGRLRARHDGREFVFVRK